MQHARDEVRRRVQQAQVRFQQVIVGGGRGGRGPEDRVVVGEEGEDDAEEEGGCWAMLEGKLREKGREGGLTADDQECCK